MRLNKTKIFLSCCLSFIIGVGVASFLPIKFLEYNIIWFTLIMFTSIGLVYFWRYKNLRLIFWIGLFLFLGIWRYSISLPIINEDNLIFYNGRGIQIFGTVLDKPELDSDKQKIILEVYQVNNINVSGKLLVQSDRYPEYSYGENLRLECNLEAPEEFEGFSYDRYLAKSDIYSVCYYPEILERGEFRVNYFYSFLLKIKGKIEDKINQGSREPYSALIRALVLGDKSGVSDDARKLFAQAGISHMIAISGMHIGILVMILMWSLIYLGLNRKQAFYLIILFLLIYLTVIGFPASAVRASLMGFMVLGALYLGRLNKMINSLILVAVIILFFNPKLLRDDIGFQLSFLAVLGIIILYPRLQSYFIRKRILNLWHLSDLLVLSLSAQIFTLPIVAYNFSQVSLIAPLSNLLIVWTLPFLLSFSILAIVLSFLFPFASFLFFLPVELILFYILQICEILVKIPLSYIRF